MQQQEIHNFLERYFISNESPIIENHHGFLHVQLSIDLDKALMNRPFYWHYLEKTGGTPNPMEMVLITDPEKSEDKKKGEQIHFGSPRLHQIFSSARELGGYIRLFEQADGQSQSTALQPWLCLNTKISYQCDRKKDLILSLGLNLITGEIKDQFHDFILSKSLTPKIPDYCFTLSPLITPKSGMVRLENAITSFIEKEDHQWAEEAQNRWDTDLALLETFYEECEDKPERYELEKSALQQQYEPKIRISIINGGLFYLSKGVY